MPALIVKAPHAGAIVQGVTLRDGSKVFKTVECRGKRCLTPYRGAVAIFVSKSYDYDTESHYVWFGSYSEMSAKKQASGANVKVTPEQDLHFRAWSNYTSAWSYSLVGYARLTNVVDGSKVRSEAQRFDLHKQATDYRGEWMSDPPAVYLQVESMYELQTASGPKFNQVCYGCTVAQPQHNATACHVNWQTVSLNDSDVPNHVQAEVKPWPVK